MANRWIASEFVDVSNQMDILLKSYRNQRVSTVVNANEIKSHIIHAWPLETVKNRKNKEDFFCFWYWNQRHSKNEINNSYRHSDEKIYN